MTYQVLARKWRPQEFAGLIGQEPIVTALRNALTERRLAQAYLFSGIRGVGKTTAARVLAKALNCENGPTAEPCNDCLACREITAGRDMDVLEVDAATYSKVDQVRELTEGLKYSPARDRYKVVVLDEVHRLSRQAFDALLKIVEEPPDHLVFVFATTEIDAVPATLLSRCQEFHFRRVPSSLLAAHLRTLCDAEGIEASDATLRLVARAGEGSVRDAVALLDQLATFGGGEIRDRDARDLLGGLDTAIFHRLLAAVLEGDRPAVSAVVRDVETHGWDPHNVFAQFLAYCRDAVHLALGAAPGSVELPAEDAESLATLVGPVGYEDLLRLLHTLMASEETIRRSELPPLALEIAWLRAAELPKLQRVEELLGGVPPPGPAGGGGGRPRAQSRPAESAPAEAEGAGDAGDDVERFLERVSARRQDLAALLRDQPLAFDAGVLTLPVPSGADPLARKLRRRSNLEFLEGVLGQLFGDGARLELREPPESATSGPAPPPEPDSAVPDAVRDHPTVQAVLEIFDGTIESVQPASREERTP